MKNIYLNLKLLLCLCAALFLIGCSHQVSTRDGAPLYCPVDISHVKNAEPKAEHKSPHGNSSSYEVFGKKYHVKPSSIGYKERGIASWYGTKFHGRQTSNLEVYDMFKMTAAHKSLPLPTYLRVTNLKNHHSVIVRVNDRGPFHGDRILDLSYVAAAKLGMLPTGTAYVEVEAINPTQIKSTDILRLAKNQSKFSPSKSPIDRHKFDDQSLTEIYHQQPAYLLQVAAFHEKEPASRLRQKLAKMMKHPVIVNLDNSDPRHPAWYRVQIGPFDSLDKLNLLAHKLTQITKLKPIPILAQR